MNFKYKTKFSSEVKASQIKKNKFLQESIASISDLSPLKELIKSGDIDYDKNIDIVGLAFNGALINKFNRNGDGIDTTTAKKIKDYFIHKPTNIEHNKKQIVGHIISSAFSDLQTNEIITDIDSYGLDVFNLSFGSILYTHTHQDFGDIVKKSIDPQDELYMSVSASWELGFNDYVIAVGSENLKEAEIVEDPKVISELSEFLTSFEGEGKMEDGTPVYRLVVGEVYPLGIGFTTNPAADVKGVILAEENENQDKDLHQEKASDKKKLKKISQSEKNNVTESINIISTTMEKKELMEDFKALLEEKMPEHNFSQEAVANIGRVIGDAIKSKSEQYEQELSDLANQKKSLDEAEARMKKDIEELKTQLENSEASVESLKNEILETKKDSAFNSRMEEIEANYDLSDSDRELLAKEVGSLDIEDSSFDEYKEKISIMWAHKNKEYIEAKEKEFQKRLEEEVKKRISGESEASSEESEDEVDVEEALASAKEEEEVIPNNNTESSEEPQSLREKFSTAFAKENLTITF